MYILCFECALCMLCSAVKVFFFSIFEREGLEIIEKQVFMSEEGHLGSSDTMRKGSRPFQGSTFIVVLFVYCYIVFHLQLNKYVSLRYIQLGLGNRVTIFLVKSCQLCLPSVHFVVAKLYFSVFPFGVGGLMWL